MKPYTYSPEIRRAIFLSRIERRAKAVAEWLVTFAVVFLLMGMMTWALVTLSPEPVVVVVAAVPHNDGGYS